jgi:hypothetical protein
MSKLKEKFIVELKDDEMLRDLNGFLASNDWVNNFKGDMG